MSVKTWTLPPARPIVENRPTKAQILGILVVGCLLGVLLVWTALHVAESQREPDTLNESGPWQVLAPSAGGQLGVSDFSGDRSTLSTGCGQFPYSYTQSGTSLTLAALPPAPKGCGGPATESHV